MSGLELMWEGGNVKRYHTETTLRTDYVGHHSFNVACIIMHLRPDASAELLKAALMHDVGERRLGDMPAPAKRAMPDYPGGDSFRTVFGRLEEEHMRAAGLEFPDLNSEEAWTLKLADALDGMRFCLQERRMGNRLIEPVWENFRTYAAELLFGPGKHPLRQFEEELQEPARFCDYQVFKHLVGGWYGVVSK